MSTKYRGVQLLIQMQGRYPWQNTHPQSKEKFAVNHAQTLLLIFSIFCSHCHTRTQVALI